MTIDCRQFESHLNDLLDQRAALQPDGPLEDHARACPACGQLLASYRDWLRALAHCTIPASRHAAADVAQRVWEQFHRTSQAPAASEPDRAAASLPTIARRNAQCSPSPAGRGLRAIARWAQDRPWTVALGASLAVLVVVAALVGNPWAHRPEVPVAEVPDPVRLPPAEQRVVPRPALRSLAQEASTRCVDLVRDAQSSLAGAAILVPELETEAVGWLLPEQPPALRGVASGWRTLANSTGSVVDLLTAVLPEDDVPANGERPGESSDPPL